ncbi:MAG: restriction endonuclease subunit S, partial [Candidatus Electrothrix sp. ATG2]|nr:restriction endonuclease subunit S [Candidatus Electrothrix sp. ATG2]
MHSDHRDNNARDHLHADSFSNPKDVGSRLFPALPVPTPVPDAAQPKLNKQKCSAIPVALPPTKAEQQAIAEALSDADALIES